MAKRKPKPECEFTSQANHSNDRVTVYFGDPTPATLCGFHASEYWIKNAIAFIKGSRNGA